MEYIKIILVGDSGVGKTALINRYYNDSFLENNEATVAMNFVEKTITINNKKITLKIWDTAGQEQYKSCNKLFIKNSNIVIFVYDTTSKISFENLDYWYNYIQTELGQDPYLGMVGNKADLFDMEEVTKEQGEEYAKKCNAYFSILSAKKDKQGINDYFQKIVELCLGNKKLIRMQTIQITEDNILEPTNKGGCCGGGRSSKKEKEIKISFFGDNIIEKDKIIQTIVGENNKNENIKNINEYKYIYQLDNKKVINTKIFEANEENLESKDLRDIIKHCRIYFLVFNINNKDNFKGLTKWINKIKKYHDFRKNFVNILGIKENNNEENNEHTVSEQGEKLAKKLGAHFQVISIDDNNSLQKLFINNLENYLKYYK